MAIQKEYERLLSDDKLMPVIEPKVDLVKLDDKVIKSSKDVKINDKLNIKLNEGELIEKVEEIK